MFLHMHYRTWTSVCPCRPTSGYLTATWRSCSWAAPPSTSLWAGVRVEHHWWVLLVGPWNICWYNWYGVYLWCFILLNCCREKVFCRNKQLSGLLSWVYVTCPSHCPRLRICRESGRNGEERLLSLGGAVEFFEKKGWEVFYLKAKAGESTRADVLLGLLISSSQHVATCSLRTIQPQRLAHAFTLQDMEQHRPHSVCAQMHVTSIILCLIFGKQSKTSEFSLPSHSSKGGKSQRFRIWNQ